MPTTAPPYLLGLLSVVLAVALSFLAQFVLSVIGFWVIETRGIRSLYMTAGTFLAGLYIPVHLFPVWLQRVAHATPFPSILQSPIDILCGRVSGSDTAEIVLTQSLWIAVVAVLGRFLLRCGRRKLEVQGG